MDCSAAVFATPRLVRFTEMEYALPREHTVQAVRRVMELIAHRGFAVPFPIEVRTVARDDALLSTAAGRESGYVAVHMYRGMEWEPYFRAVEAIMDELDGRPHWGKRHFQTAATLREPLPGLGPLPGGAGAPGSARPLRERVDRSRARPGAPRRARWRCARRALSIATPASSGDGGPGGPVRARRPRCSGPTPPTWKDARADKPIRLASKSVRCRELQERVLAREGFRGTLAFTLPEALWLASHGASEILVAYPECRHGRPRRAGRTWRPDVTVMVDSAEQLELIERARSGADAAAAPIGVCLDIDTGWLARRRSAASGRPAIAGADTPRRPRRWPVRCSPGRASRCAGSWPTRRRSRASATTPRAGRCGRARSGRCRRARRPSWRRGGARSSRRCAELAGAGAPALRFVNGGGTGSLQTTTAEAAVTELAAGSGLYGPTLFDAYRAFAPRAGGAVRPAGRATPRPAAS